MPRGKNWHSSQKTASHRMAYTVEMGQEETTALTALDDQVSAPEKGGIEPRAARQPDLAGIGWVPGQDRAVC